MIVSSLRFELTFTPRPVSPTGLSHAVVDWSMRSPRTDRLFSNHAGLA
jgi:hypothetical protein